MNYTTKLNRARKTIPLEVLIQYSSQTDNIDVLMENAKEEAKEENTTTLHVLLTYAKEVLETYESWLLGHLNYAMKEEHPKQWREERAEIKKYITKLENYVSTL